MIWECEMSSYCLNKLVHEIQFPEKRARFDADPEKFLAGFDLTPEELAAVRERDVRALWLKGVNPYLLRVYQIWTRIGDDDYRAALEGLSFNDFNEEGDSRG